ncbi:hypothetical protein MRX96_049508 [Rhipicephalus microplus]
MQKLPFACDGVCVQRDDAPNRHSKKRIEHSKSSGTSTYLKLDGSLDARLAAEGVLDNIFHTVIFIPLPFFHHSRLWRRRLSIQRIFCCTHVLLLLLITTTFITLIHPIV